MNITCETPLFRISVCDYNFELTLVQSDQIIHTRGSLTEVFRALDGRAGFTLECQADSQTPGVILIPFDCVKRWKVLDAIDWEVSTTGDQASFMGLYSEEFDDLFADTYFVGDGKRVTWDELVEEEHLSRLTDALPNWHYHNELVI